MAAATRGDRGLWIPGFRKYAAELERLRGQVTGVEALHTRLAELEEEVRALRASRVEELRRSVNALELKPRLQLIERLNLDLIAERHDGVRFTYGSRAEYKRITKWKRWDAAIAEWIGSFAPGDVFFDIGANVGSFSLLAGKLHAERVHVFSFEPGCETFAALTRNILLNSLEQVITPLQVALFDETGLKPFHYSKLGAGAALHAIGVPVDAAGRPFTPAAVQPVLAFTLDDLVETFGLPRPTRIKLDVDGMESRVLAGALRTLAHGPCDLWIEVSESDDAHAASAEVARLLADLGFELARRVDHDRPPDTSPHVYDALFVRR